MCNRPQAIQSADCLVDAQGVIFVVHEVPEAAKPRTIKIGTTVATVQPQVTEQKAA